MRAVCRLSLDHRRVFESSIADRIPSKKSEHRSLVNDNKRIVAQNNKKRPFTNETETYSVILSLLSIFLLFASVRGEELII